MYFVPLNQPESVALVIHALRAAGGQADCTLCPARKVCTRQCLTIADAVEQMLRSGALPQVGPDDEPPSPAPTGGGGGGPRLKLVK